MSIIPPNEPLRSNPNLGYKTFIETGIDGRKLAGLRLRLGPPTEDSFDPEKIELRVEEGDGAKFTSFGPKSQETFGGGFWVLPGYVKATDRYKKEVAFYTFGGSVTSEIIDSIPYLVIRSPAPIFQVVDTLSKRTPPSLLSTECEAYLGRDLGMSIVAKEKNPVKLYEEVVIQINRRLNRGSIIVSDEEKKFIIEVLRELKNGNRLSLPTHPVSEQEVQRVRDLYQ